MAGIKRKIEEIENEIDEMNQPEMEFDEEFDEDVEIKEKKSMLDKIKESKVVKVLTSKEAVGLYLATAASALGGFIGSKIAVSNLDQVFVEVVNDDEDEVEDTVVALEGDLNVIELEELNELVQQGLLEDLDELLKVEDNDEELE